jgi:urocanate hydratase
MAKANALLIKEVKLLKEKKKEAEAYLRMDKNKLNQAARAAGISFTYDEKGNVTNYTEQYNKMVDDYDKMADEYDAKGTAATEEDKQKLEEAEQKIRDVEDAMS